MVVFSFADFLTNTATIVIYIYIYTPYKVSTFLQDLISHVFTRKKRTHTIIHLHVGHATAQRPTYILHLNPCTWQLKIATSIVGRMWLRRRPHHALNP